MNLFEVQYVLSHDYISYMQRFLHRLVDPDVSYKEFMIDGEVSGLDCFDDVRAFIFE